MKKILALLFIAFAFTACSKGGDATDTAATDTATDNAAADTNATNDTAAADASESIFDFSSPEAFAKSMAEVQAKLPVADQIKFGEGLAVIGMEMTIKSLTNPEKYADIENNIEFNKELYGGKSVADIIARAADKDKVSAELQKIMLEKQQ